MLLAKLRTAVVLLLALGIAGAGVGGLLYRAPAADPPGKAEGDAARKEMKKFAGTWAVVAVESNGRKAAAEELEGLRYVFDPAGKWKLRKGDETIAEGTWTIDPGKKPKAIDYHIESTVSEQAKGKKSLGIYEIDGDMLKVCRDWPGEGKRPADFSAGPDSMRILAEYKREKSE
jgi:uncharacterized protein (TIGR03067 family)